MKLSVQKKLAAKILKCSPKRVKLAPDQLQKISKSITSADIHSLINEGTILKVQSKGVSRVRANKKAAQKRKGLQKGPGKRKGKKFASTTRKELWMIKIRLLRSFLKELKEKQILSPEGYKELYAKAGGGFFRNKRHLKIYMEEHNLVRKG